MRAFLASALRRIFGSDSSASPLPTADARPESPPVPRISREAGKTPDHVLKSMTMADAVSVMARKAGQRPASEAPPPESRVNLATKVIELVVLQYLSVLQLLGRDFPKPGNDNDATFKARLKQLAMTDVPTWLAGLFSVLPVTIPAHIAYVLIQRTANAMGHTQPLVLPDGPAPCFVADAETQLHVIDLQTGFCVFPRVIGRGLNVEMELPNGKRFHRMTVDLSGWAFRLGYAGQVFEPPTGEGDNDNAHDAAATLIPKTTRKK
ncbi:hypothetical protein FNL55_17040 [Tardiphaga sp. vice352]|uniref:hypothetical protein n=1 Tax=Tardiphaga sp. vice352 TaxID=2592816 RepID=UPI001163E319|nr:hypothetical protein [Tardiphaga sp. vice352]QDM32871.1 hypothetical protein FNL55_17040 [Tardiphaga sp. vice352]